MKTLTVKPHFAVPENRVILMAAPHPEIDFYTPVSEAENLLVLCRPQQEEKLRDLIAVEQERPRWWRDIHELKILLEKSFR